MNKISATIYKRSSEIIYWYHQFKREDGQGWLRTGETISAAAVAVTDCATDADVSAAMVDSISPWATTQVIYRLKGGVSGSSYDVTIAVDTDNNQHFEDVLRLKVI